MTLPVGTRVKRGPTWRWGNQDSEGLGTIVAYKDGSHTYEVGQKVWQRVQWDNGRFDGCRMKLHTDVVPAVINKTFNDYL